MRMQRSDSWQERQEQVSMLANGVCARRTLIVGQRPVEAPPVCERPDPDAAGIRSRLCCLEFVTEMQTKAVLKMYGVIPEQLLLRTVAYSLKKQGSHCSSACVSMHPRHQQWGVCLCTTAYSHKSHTKFTRQTAELSRSRINRTGENYK
jgi:hypothetical protein